MHTYTLKRLSNFWYYIYAECCSHILKFIALLLLSKSIVPFIFSLLMKFWMIKH